MYKTGVLKDLPPRVQKSFTSENQANLNLRYCDQREVGHGSYGTVFYAIDTKSGTKTDQKSDHKSDHKSTKNAAKPKNTSETTTVQPHDPTKAQKSHKIVAIKRMQFSKDKEKWNDIVNEIKVLLSCQIHENIIQLYNCHLVEDSVCIIMEYCIGSASDVIETIYNEITEQDIAAITFQTLKGLEWLHSKKIIHRDVKAGNILLYEENDEVGMVKLADFGSASQTCPANSFVGTPYWMAPEVILAMEEGQYRRV